MPQIFHKKYANVILELICFDYKVVAPRHAIDEMQFWTKYSRRYNICRVIWRDNRIKQPEGSRNKGYAPKNHPKNQI